MRSSKAIWAGILASLAPLAASVWAYRIAQRSEARLRFAQFSREADRLASAVTDEVAAYGDVTRGARGFLSATPGADPASFARFVASLALDAMHPDVLAVGYAQRAAGERAEGGAEVEYFPIRMLEPDRGNRGALAFDLASEPLRRAAIARARETGDLSLTAPVALNVDPEARRGALVFLPVYREGAPLSTPSERLAATEGVVFAAFRTTELLAHLPPRAVPGVTIRVYDGEDAIPEKLLAESQDGGGGPYPLETRRALESGGRRWTIVALGGPSFMQATARREPVIVLLGGALASLLFGGMVAVLVATRVRALALAQGIVRTLRENEGSIQVVFDSVADPILTFDRDGLVTSCNRAAERVFLKPREALLGQKVDLMVPGAMALAEHHGGRAEIEGLREGGAFPLAVSVSDTSHAGQTMFIAALRDLTFDTRTALVRDMQYATTRVLAESVFLDDALPRILEVLCGGVEAEVGLFSRTDPSGGCLRPVASFAGPEKRAEVVRRECEASSPRPGEGLAGRSWERASLVVGRKDQDPALDLKGFESGLALPVALGGEVLGVLEFYRAGTLSEDPHLFRTLESIGTQIAQFVERDEADRTARANDDRIRAVAENMLEGLITVDGRATIRSVNPAAEQMFGYSAFELVGKHLKVLMPQSVLPQADQFLSDARSKALGKITEWEGRRKNGDVFRFELSLFEFQTPEGIQVGGHIRDISERRKLERMKREFVATVSHELRTPLTSIRGSLSLLSGGALGELPEEAADVVKIAERNTVRLISLINDILDLERLEVGKMEMHCEDHPVQTILNRSQEVVTAFADESGIALEIPESPLEVKVDADRVVQVLVNLLSNAIKFSPKGSVVRVAVAPSGELVEFKVRDEGRGIPAEHREAIFERFRQVEGSDARKKGGTGLGLAIARAIIEEHGGRIGVLSEPGKGSTFFFTVPAVRPAEDALLESVGQGARALDQADALILDDDSALLSVVVRQLLKEGIPSRTVTTPARALAECREKAPGLLIVEVALRAGGGEGLIESLRAEPDLKETPLLVYTAKELSDEERERLSLGPTRILTKSKATDEDFISAVKELWSPAVATRGET
jgi:PAS domain S-box-containing protein